MSFVSRHLLAEIVTVFVCVIAASIGPLLLINAHFRFSFPLGGLTYSIAAGLLFNLTFSIQGLLSRLLNVRFNLAVGIFSSILFIGIIAIRNIDHLMSLFKIQWRYGFASFPIIIAVAVIIIFIVNRFHNNYKDSMALVGLEYFLPLTIIILLLPVIPNSEGKMYLLM